MRGQHWDARLGAEPPVSENQANRAMEEYFEAGIERGVDPPIIAAEVIDAIRGGRFWILSRPRGTPRAGGADAPAERQLNPV